MRLLSCLAAMWVVFACGAAVGQSLREELKDTEIAPHWIYDDLSKAIDAAKASGKPLLVVLRCVPCPPGRTLDGQVMQPTGEMEALQRNFVCVRVIQTNGLDLKLFQYDYDMSWAAMFLNADGTIYGRSGTRTASGPGSDAHLSLESFQKAAEQALELHKSYPANRRQLADKMGSEPEYARPEATPGLQDKPAKATTRQTCIHCHMVKEYALRAKWEAGRLSLKDLLVYPMPDQIGFSVDRNDGLRITSVTPDSPAAQAGLASGDRLVTLAGQPLISLADIQWVLHTAPNETQLAATVRRGDATLEKQIVLSGDWKQSDIAWRASTWYGLRQGVKFEPLSAAEKEKRGIAADRLALAVKGLFGRGGPKVQQAGMKANDVIVAVDGNAQAMNESEFLIGLRLKHGPGDSVQFTILRGTDRKELTVPLW